MALLAGKVAVITGSSRGIGRGCALKFAEHGVAGLVLHYFGDEATTTEVAVLVATLQASHAGVAVIIIPGDIGDPETSTKVGPSQCLYFFMHLYST
jgi:L-rhamnose 1-dehydrogenase